MSYSPAVPEPVVDFVLPPRYPSRYRVRLISINRFEANVRFSYRPRIFRSGEFEDCPARLILVWAFRAAHVMGQLHLPDDGKGTRGRLSFDRTLGLHEVSFFRRACLLPMTRDDELIRLPAPAQAVPADFRRVVVLGNPDEPEEQVLEPVWEAVGW